MRNNHDMLQRDRLECLLREHIPQAPEAPESLKLSLWKALQRQDHVENEMQDNQTTPSIFTGWSWLEWFKMIGPAMATVMVVLALGTVFLERGSHSHVPNEEELMAYLEAIALEDAFLDFEPFDDDLHLIE